MKKFRKTQWFLYVLGLMFFLFSCNRADESGNDGGGNSATVDPLVGYWKLKVVTVSQGSVDVSNVECWKESYIKVEPSTLEFFLRFKIDSGCVNDQGNFSSNWTNVNGTYYLVGANGQQVEMPIKLLDGNQTLQVTTSESGQTMILSYRK